MNKEDSKAQNSTELNTENKEYTAKLVCDKKEYIKKQERILAAFYKDFFTWSCMNIGMWILTGVMMLGQVSFFIMPYQDIVGDEDFGRSLLCMVAVMCVNAVISYIHPYTQYKDSGVATLIYDKIKYLPISRAALRYFLFKKMIKFLGIVFMVDFVLQIVLAATIMMGEITIENILYPVVVGFFIPFAVCSVYTLLAGRFGAK